MCACSGVDLMLVGALWVSLGIVQYPLGPDSK
jgi:hypothetical protein